MSAAKARYPVIGFAGSFGSQKSEAPIGHQKSPLSLNGLQQGSAAQNRYNTLHVVGEHIECHLGCDLVSSSHQEVRRTHPSLYGPERMLCRLTTQGHLIGVLIEPLLNLLQHILVLPTRDAPLEAAHVRLGCSNILFAREEQRDIDRYAPESGFLDRRER